MNFNETELQDLREYVSSSGIDDLLTITPDHITVVSEDFPDRFVATIRLMTLTNSYGFAVFVEDTRPGDSDLGFTYGLPVSTVMRDGAFSLREVVRRTMNLLTDVSDTVKSLSLAVKGMRYFAKQCETLNASLDKVKANPVFIPLELARVAARSAVEVPSQVDVSLKIGG